MEILKGYKFRIRTTPELEHIFNLYAGHARFVWNKMLAMNLELLNTGYPIARHFTMNWIIGFWRQTKQYGFLEQAPKQILEQKAKDLDRAFTDWFDPKQPLKRKPRFKKRNKSKSFTFPQHFEISGNRINLPKIGWVRFFKSREIDGTPKNVTISKSGNNWFVSIQTKIEIDDPVLKQIVAIGADMGVKRLVTLSDGDFWEGINSLRKNEKKLAKAQNELSRKVKFSQNWKKQLKRVNKIHTKIANIRHDILHKVTTCLSKNHAIIVLEDLPIDNMTKSAKGTVENPGRNVKQKSGLNKAILDQGWGMFKQMLEYKMKWKGGIVVYVPPQYSSQECPICHTVSKYNRYSQSGFKCIACDFEENADRVGAMNVLERGLRLIACGEVDISDLKAQEPWEAKAVRNHILLAV